MWGLLIFILFLIIPSAYSSTYTHDDGLTYEDKNCQVIVYDIAGRKAGTFGYGISGRISGTNYKFPSADFNCEWKTEYGDNGTIYYSSSTNELLNITQVWNFTPNKAGKITYIIHNNLVKINNIKFWIIQEVLEDDDIYYNGTRHRVRNDNLSHFKDELNDIIPSIQTKGAYTFYYRDLLEDNFNITDFYTGSSDVIGINNKVIVGIAVSKGTGVLNKGATIIIDPEVTGGKSPTTFNDPESDWTLASNLGASDDSKALTETLGHMNDMGTFDFGVGSSDTTIHGIIVTAEGQCACEVGCAPRPTATLSVRLSWDGGISYTAHKTYSTFRCVNDQTKTVGSFSDDWGHAWIVNSTVNELNNTNFRVQINYSAANTGNFGGFANGGMDHIAVNVNFTTTPPNLTWVDPTPANNTHFGSMLRLKFQSDVFLPSNQGCHLNLQKWNGTGWANNTNIFFDPIENSMNCSIALGDNISFAGESQGGDLVTLDEGEMYRGEGLRQPFILGQIDTGKRNWTKNNTRPTVTVIYPPNKTTGILTDFVLLNFSINDTRNDLMSIEIFADNQSDLKNSFVYSAGNLTTGNYSFNFSHFQASFNETDLYAYYRFDNESAIGENNTLIVDRGGRFNGTVNGGTPIPVKRGRFGGGYEFTANGWIKIGNDTDFYDVCVGEGCTFSFWVKASPTLGIGDVISKYGAPDNLFFRITTRPGFQTAIRWEISGDGTNAENCIADTSSGAVNLGEWNHVVALYDNTSGNNRAKVYVNTILVEDQSCLVDFTTIDVNAWQDTQDTYIDRLNTGTVAKTLDELVVWNRVLSQDEIVNLYKLTNQTYFWNVTVSDEASIVQDSNNRLTSTNGTNEFTLGAALTVCTYACTGQIITTTLNCFDQNLVLDGAGTITFQAEVNASNVSVTGGCLGGFLDKLNVD